MEPFSLQNESYFMISSFGNDELVAGFTTKNGGKSKKPYESLNLGFHVHDVYDDVVANREKLAKLIGFPLANWVGAQQTHEVEIRKVEHSDCGRGSVTYDHAIPKTDGFFTREKGILLTLCFADCVPLFFMNKNRDAIGIAHAGWRGTVQGIGEEMVKTFKDEQIVSEDILVVIGPSICENCYIVDDHVISLVDKKITANEKKPYEKIQTNQYRLNLRQLNKQILLKAGILEENIFISNLCSSCEKDIFFSHRRDFGKTGRMIGFIGLKED